MEEKIIVTLEPRHFIGSTYTKNSDCALARAIKEIFPQIDNIIVGGNCVGINYIDYYFDEETADKIVDAYKYEELENFNSPLEKTSLKKPLKVFLTKEI